jgi:hypothetical protein
MGWLPAGKTESCGRIIHFPIEIDTSGAIALHNIAAGILCGAQNASLFIARTAELCALEQGFQDA